MKTLELNNINLEIYNIYKAKDSVVEMKEVKKILNCLLPEYEVLPLHFPLLQQTIELLVLKKEHVTNLNQYIINYGYLEISREELNLLILVNSYNNNLK